MSNQQIKSHQNVISVYLHLLIFGFNSTAQAETSFYQIHQINKNNGLENLRFLNCKTDSKWHELKTIQNHRLCIFLSKVIVLPGCTQRANEFKALYPQFIKNNAVVFEFVSLDDVKSHQKFSEKLG